MIPPAARLYLGRGGQPRHVDLDVFVAEVVDQAGHRVDAGRVHMGRPLGVEDEGPRLRASSSQRLAHPPCEVPRVREEQSVIEAIHDDSRGDAGGRMERDVRIAVQRLDPAENRVVRSSRASDCVDHGEADGEQERRRGDP